MSVDNLDSISFKADNINEKNYSCVCELATKILDDFQDNNGLTNDESKFPFRYFLKRVSCVNENKTETENFVSYVRSSEHRACDKRVTLKNEQIIGLVTSTVPRMIYANEKFGFSIEKCCEFENILIEAEKQNIAEDYKKYMEKNRNYTLAMRYRQTEAKSKEKTQKLYKKLENKAEFENYINEFANVEFEHYASFSEDTKPSAIKVVADPKNACLTMMENINEINNPCVFVG